MRIHEQDQNLVDSGNTKATKQFQITANGTAFQILSSGLYSDKIMAVIRELSCNAYDSHVAAKKKSVPIKVTMPTVENPVFKVQDFGTGLDDEQVTSLYTNYFASDKRDDNAQIGGFGLGSKSPFAYTDSFTVTAIKNGVCRIYSAYLTAGAPAITQLSEEPTSEPNGVEVSMLVKPSDIDEFHVKANIAYTWFDVKPDVYNLMPAKKPIVRSYSYESQYLAIPSTDHTAYRKVQSTYSSQHEAVVIMGNVCYPLNVSAVAGQNTNLVKFLNQYVELRIPIGSVNVAASREELQYDPASLEFLKNLINDEYAAFVTFVKSFDSAVDKWEKTVAAHNFYTKLINKTAFSDLLKVINSSLNAIFVNTTVDLPKLAGTEDDVQVYWYETHTVGKKLVQSGQYTARNYSRPAQMRKHASTSIYVNDIPNGSSFIPAYRARVPGTSMANTLYITATKKYIADAIQHAKDISDALGGMPIKLASEYKNDAAVAALAAKPTKKYNFVEIDEREVEVFNIETGTISNMKLGDVDDAFFVLKDTSSTRGDSWFVGLADTNVISDSDESNITKFATDFFKQVKNWSFTKTFIYVKPVELKNLKLLERGWKPFIPAFYEALTTTFKKEYEAIKNTYPQVQTPSYSHWYRFNGWYLAFASIRKNLPVAYKAEFETVLSNAGVLSDVNGFEAAVKPANAPATIRDKAISLSHAMSSLDTKKLLTLKHEPDFTTAFLAAHPGFSFIEAEKMEKAAGQYPADVIRVIKAGLGV